MLFVSYNQDFRRILGIAGNGGSRKANSRSGKMPNAAWHPTPSQEGSVGSSVEQEGA